MTDEQKIRRAWDACPKWDFKNGPCHIPEPIEYQSFVGSDRTATKSPTVDHIVFRHEYGVREGRSAQRILGKLRGTEIQVAQAFK